MLGLPSILDYLSQMGLPAIIIRDVLLTKKVTKKGTHQKNSHFETASNTFQSKM